MSSLCQNIKYQLERLQWEGFKESYFKMLSARWFGVCSGKVKKNFHPFLVFELDQGPKAADYILRRLEMEVPQSVLLKPFLSI